MLGIGAARAAEATKGIVRRGQGQAASGRGRAPGCAGFYRFYFDRRLTLPSETTSASEVWCSRSTPRVSPCGRRLAALDAGRRRDPAAHAGDAPYQGREAHHAADGSSRRGLHDRAVCAHGRGHLPRTGPRGRPGSRARGLKANRVCASLTQEPKAVIDDALLDPSSQHPKRQRQCVVLVDGTTTNCAASRDAEDWATERLLWLFCRDIRQIIASIRRTTTL